MNSTNALLDVCRVCLVRRGAMRDIKNTKLNVVYEMLTQAKLIRSEGVPETVCYLCHSQLKKCCKFMEFAQESEMILKLCLLGFQKETIVTPNRSPLNLKKIEPILLSMPNIIKTVHTIKIEVPKPINDETFKYSNEKHKINDNTINKHNIEKKNNTEIKQSAMEIEENAVKNHINDKSPEEKDKSVFNIIARDLDINAVKKQTAVEITSDTEKDEFDINNINKDKCVIKTEQKVIEKVPDRGKAERDIEKANIKVKKDQNDIEENNADQIAFIKAQIAILKQRILREKEKMSQDKIIKEEFVIKEELIAEGEKIEKEISDDFMDLDEEIEPIQITLSFACSICSLPCGSAASRDLHMREHSEPTPFACRCCRRSFVKLPHADSHMRIHTNKKQRQCNICNSQFPDMVLLQLHMRTHISERHLCCKSCRKRYRTVDTLREHLKTHKEKKK